jgi:hypothetical protein
LDRFSQQNVGQARGKGIEICQKDHNFAKKGFYVSGKELGDDMSQEN